VPWDVAFQLGEDEVKAYSIVFGEFEGNKFDYAAMEWVKEGG
jgi:hypothetical protein